METLQVKRISKFGIQLEDGTYRYTSEAVKKFLTDKLPGEIEIIDEDDKGHITKVNVLGSSPKQERSFDRSGSNNAEFRVNVDAGNILQRQIEFLNGCDLTLDEKKKILEEGKLAETFVETFNQIKKALSS